MKKYWFGAILLTSFPAWAILPYTATPAEVAMCEAKGMPAGKGYQGHYCDGLRFIDRAYSAMGNKRDMEYYLSVAIDNFNYELKRKVVDKDRQAEFHVGKARALKLLGRNAEAAGEFNKALNCQINSPDAYQVLADHFHETGNKKKALEMVTEGLKRSPNSKGLKRRYTEFGGKLPYPEAADKTPSTEESKADVKPEANPAVAQQPPRDVVSETADKPTTPPEVIPQVEPTKIGSPKNPYCRFCPD